MDRGRLIISLLLVVSSRRNSGAQFTQSRQVIQTGWSDYFAKGRLFPLSMLPPTIMLQYTYIFLVHIDIDFFTIDT